MKKLVVKLDLHDDKAKQKALKTVSTLQGIDSIGVDMNDKKLTVVGTVDPVAVVSKLRKYWRTDIVTLGPAKEPEKKEDTKAGGEQANNNGEADAAGKEQQDPNKKPAEEGQGGGGENKPAGDADQEKKNEGEQQLASAGGGDDEGKKQGAGEGAAEKRIDPVLLELARAYRAYNNNPRLNNSSYYYYAPSMEDNPNACSIS